MDLIEEDLDKPRLKGDLDSEVVANIASKSSSAIVAPLCNENTHILLIQCNHD